MARIVYECLTEQNFVLQIYHCLKISFFLPGFKVTEMLHFWTNTVVSHVGGRTFWAKILKSLFLVSLASLGVERSRNKDFTTPGAQKAQKKLLRMGSYVHFTVYI